MFAQAKSGAVIGVEAHPVIVEVFRGSGLPQIALVGLARGATKEALVRVRAAILASNFSLPSRRQVVNLIPAELPKEASALDLALAVALLAAGEIIPPTALEGRRFFGELSLGGQLEPSNGTVLVADLARKAKDQEVLVPETEASEAALIPGIRVIGVKTLNETVEHLLGQRILPATTPLIERTSTEYACFSEVRGQEQAKQALLVAAAGNHNVLMIGSPGSGKTMLARRLPGILPPLEPEECIEVTRILSAVGKTRGNFGLIKERPFRAPHHTASEVALCGGGSIPKPGEITLAHRGVLFLDELPEFSRRALEALREPLEEGAIHVARASMSLCFPARVLLIAAMNPCPCGFFNPKQNQTDSEDPNHLCLCSSEHIQRYLCRISGPLLDRIDLHIFVEPVPFRDFTSTKPTTTSKELRQQVIAARERQHQRLGAHRTNANMTEQEVRNYIQLDGPCLALLDQVSQAQRLSNRAISRSLKVARTIADLADSAQIKLEHISAALHMRAGGSNPILWSLSQKKEPQDMRLFVQSTSSWLSS